MGARCANTLIPRLTRFVCFSCTDGCALVAFVSHKQNETTPLIQAAKEGDWESMRLLLDNGARVDDTDLVRFIPLICF